MTYWVLIQSRISNRPIAAVPTKKGKSKSQIMSSMRGKLKKAYKFRILTKTALDSILIKRGKTNIKKRMTRTRRKVSKRKKPVKRRIKKRKVVKRRRIK